MNKIFKKIWNKARGCFVAVSEVLTSACQCAGKSLIGSVIGLSLITSAQAAVVFTDADGNKLTIGEGIVKSDGEASFYGAISVNNSYLQNNGRIHVYGTLTPSGTGSITGSDQIFIYGSSSSEGTNSIANKSGTLELFGPVEYLKGGISNRGTMVFHNDLALCSYDGENIRGSYHNHPDAHTDFLGAVTISGGELANSSTADFQKEVTLSGGYLFTGGTADFQKEVTVSGGYLYNNGTADFYGAVRVESGEVSLGFDHPESTTTNFHEAVTVSGGELKNWGTVTILEGLITSGNLTNKGTLNIQGSWTESGSNRYLISSTVNNRGTINFKSGFKFVSDGHLNSSGTLQTNNAANIFDSLGRQGQTALSTVSLQAALPEEAKTSLTDLFRHYVPGTVAQSLIDHATFTGGKVIVTGVNLTTTQCDDLVQAFKAKFFLPDAFTSAVSQQC